MKTISRALKDTFHSAAYGGAGWQARCRSHRQELGRLWAPCGLENEWGRLRTVLVHRPGEELTASADDHDSVQMLEPLDIGRAAAEHDEMVQAYRDQDIAVVNLDPATVPAPNQMFCADLFAMTPEGAILARPASNVRAGEERAVAARLAAAGVPILRTLTGNATFEGADLMWINRNAAMLGIGLRTNREAADQIEAVLAPMGVVLHVFDMPYGTMHFMGMLRIVDRALAIAWPRRTPHAAVMALREHGYRVEFLPDAREAESGRSFNFVTLAPGRIMTARGNPVSLAFYESLGIDCLQVPVAELSRAAGATGCLTGIVHRESE